MYKKEIKLQLLLLSLITVGLTSLLGIPDAVHAVAVNICEEVETSITHPAEYTRQKIKRHGLSALFFPHCFTPAWITDPQCYVVKNVKVKNAWTEIKKTFNCKDYQLSPEEAFTKWLVNNFVPFDAFHAPTHILTETLGAYVSAAMVVAQPLPPDIINELRQTAQQERGPFTLDNLNTAKWIHANRNEAKILWPGTYNVKEMNAITYYNLIIVNDEFLQGLIYDRDLKKVRPDECQRRANWAHELTHVRQYNLLGWEPFLISYVTEGLLKGGTKSHDALTREKEAIAVEQSIERTCLATIVKLSPLRPNVIEIRPRGIKDTPVVEPAPDPSSKITAIEAEIQKMVEEGVVTVEDDTIVRGQEEAERRLRPLFNTQ
jgi:hypothetical protein